MKTQKITLLGVMLALTVVLSIAESMFPAVAFLPPGVKIGLSNVVIMYAVFFIGKKEAFFLAFLKSVFVLSTRSVTAFILSLSGGILSIIVIIILMYTIKKISYIILSVFGAVFHNIGQITALSLILKQNYIFYYIPILIISGVIMGCITGMLLKAVMPALYYINKKNDN